MQLDPLPEEVRVNIFVEGLRTGVARTEVFRVHLSTFEEAVDIALNAEFISKRLAMVHMGTPNLRLTRQSPWISVMRTMTKQSFKL